MHHHELLIFFALLLFAFGLFSKLAERSSLTGPMFFMSVGIVASPLALDLFSFSPELDAVILVAELALTLVLFNDASLIDLKVLTRSPSRIPIRLLLIGLPLTMLLGTALGAWMFDGSIFAIALMALILSPTDAALGQAVVKSERVPDRIRQSISVESGLNDGIALPPVLFCLALLGTQAESEGGQSWIGFLLMQVTVGPLVGAAVGYAGGRLIERMSGIGWMDGTFQRLSVLPLAILAYALAEIVGGNGFIAAFCAGIGLRLGAVSSEIRHSMQEFGEAEGTQLIMVVFLLFGLAMVPEAIGYWGWVEFLYALASLTVLRMVPVALSLVGAGLDWRSVAFIGWFGPRGIASVLYLLMAIGSIGLAGYEQVMSVIVLTVVISVYAHGISAAPLSERYGRSVGQDIQDS